jgi:hypothetical protein
MVLYKTETCVGVDAQIMKVKVKCIVLVCKQWIVKMHGETDKKKICQFVTALSVTNTCVSKAPALLTS